MRFFRLILTYLLLGSMASCGSTSESRRESSHGTRQATEPTPVPHILAFSEQSTVKDVRAVMRAAFDQYASRPEYATAQPGEIPGRRPLAHLFTVPSEAGELMCLTGGFSWGGSYGRGTSYHFIFRDGRLEKIIEPREFQRYFHTMPARGEPRTDYNEDRPFHFAQAVDHAPEIAFSELRQAVEHAFAERTRSARNLEPLPAPIQLLARPQQREASAHYERHLELMYLYDATRIGLGMTMEEVDAALGSPSRTAQGRHGTVRTYGEEAKLGRYAAPSIDVCFENRQTTEVYSAYTTEW